MEPKKISFGFSKITKKPNLLPVKTTEPENQVELIKCLEGQEIKLVEERKESAPIVIPMKENGKTSAALASLMKRRAVLLGEDDEPPSESTVAKSSNINNVEVPDDDLDKRAAREILADLQKSKEAVQDEGLILPILKPDEIPLDGAKESNMEDYEAIPIEQYGLAMLRGMGWVQPPPSKDKKLGDEAPMVRPKGMGLGADKALKPKPLLIPPEKNETLEIKKQAYVRILGGKYKDAYGQIEGFDDDAGRVIVKLAIGGSKEAFNEFLCQPVSKKEFTQYGKCINTAKYEEYKKMENEHGQIIVKKEKAYKQDVETKSEREEKKLIKMESDYCFTSNAPSSRKRFDNDNTSRSSNHRSERSRSRSKSQSQKHNSNQKNDKDDYISSYDKSSSSTNESDTDSAYEQRHKHHKKSKTKSKSHSHKSKVSKKKTRHHRSNSTEIRKRKTNKDSSFSDDTEGEHSSHHHKKNKKKTKKSKKHRSRTPSRNRR